MQIGLTVLTKIDDWKLAQEAEQMGFDSVWFPDSQMIWSDCYATMALAAQATSKVRLGTGVSIPGTRIAPVTAHSIASINRLAPGRVFLGLGTGHTAMRVMGLNPMRLKAFEEYLRVVRTLLQGDEVDFDFEGERRSIQFLHQDLGFLNLADPIPIYVAANGPKALQLAGKYGDGLVSAGAENPDMVAFSLGMVQQGAKDIGRELPENYHMSSLSNAVVLQPGEKITDDRVVDHAGAWVTCLLHFVYEIYEYTDNEEMVPDFMHGVWEEYREFVTKMQTPKDKRYREIHNGHATFLRPEERRFVTPELIRGTHLVGTVEEVVEQVRRAESAGLDEITLAPGLAYSRIAMRQFAPVLAKL
jgi:alkanesulfonate monooxygenase SsuD/methylene tetrahydromethanopterin reductase-like flavin-dependent oxidoreductase (luciferase family)